MAPTLCGICFDLDDTLIVYEPAVRNALKQTAAHPALREAGIDVTTLTEAVLSAYNLHYGYGTAGYGQLAALSPHTFQEQLTVAALRALGLPMNLAAPLGAAYRDAENEGIRLDPDTRATLTALQPHFRLGVITNGPAQLQREKLQRFDLERYFHAIVIDTEFGYPKPDRRIFDHMADRLGFPPNKLMFVGNAMDADIHGAADAGWTTAWLAPEVEKECAPLPHHHLHRLSELLELPTIVELLQRDSEGGRPSGR